MGLKTYQEKRDFDQTPEPSGKVRDTGRQRFVVQEHHASRLHFDFRLEIEGVLKSWAIPKGPSLNPRDRRLAVQVEDHPVAYINFKGHIDEGNYGAGEVYIWDSGRYALAEGEDPGPALTSGRLKFRLDGKKLKGEFNLVQMQDRPDQWLLIKGKDEYADPNWQLEQVHVDHANGQSAARRTRRARGSQAGPSAKAAKKTRAATGARAAKSAKTSKASKTARAAKRTKAARTTRKRAPARSNADAVEGEPAPFPGFIAPMLATLVDRPFDDPDWLFETKWDGVRALAYLDQGQVRLLSRNEKDMSPRYPELAGLPKAVRARQALLDGEIVILDDGGRSSFQPLQARVGLQDTAEIGRLARTQPVVLVAFDLLYLDGRDLRAVPLLQRKARLQEILSESERVRLSPHVVANGQKAFDRVAAQGYEGLIAKRLDSPYHSGRAGNWLKIKTVLRQEVVIGGYTEPRRTRPYLGALVAGLYRRDELIYVGHVGGGFDHASLRQVYALLQPLHTSRPPFAEPPITNEAVHWVEPRLVAEVKFAEWTGDMRLRQPIFMGLRDDKDPRQCVFERPKNAAAQVANADQAEAARADEQDEVTEAPVNKPAAKRTTPARAASTTVPADKAFARRAQRGDQRVKAGRHTVELTSLDRVYWPDEGYTKADLLRYEWQMAEHKLPYLADRPLILKRYPNGIDSPSFFQHDVNDVPAFVRTVQLESETGRAIDYVVCANAACLLYLANMGAIAQNPWNSRVANLDRPDWLVFDLDPSDNVPFGDLCDLALGVKDVLDSLDLEACAKTSGSRGLHVYVPLRPVYPYATIAAFAERVAARVVAENPGPATLERSKKKRAARSIYVDHLQNARGKSVAGPYAVRARPGATVSAPLTWREVKRHVDPHDYTIKTMPRRLARLGDLFAPVLAKKQSLERAQQRLEKRPRF
jgi:bifunctional non-homologous end joining protein LigD